MSKLSPKNKIFAVMAVWLIASVIMFVYIFPALASSNQKILDTISSQKKELALLTGEQESYNQARLDLNTLARKPIQPDSFFSKDITLVTEIETLQNLGQSLGLTLSLSGISGTVGSAAKAKTLSNIVVVPYSISLQGPFPKVVDFVQALENLDFITNVTGVSVSASGNNTVNAGLSANFYLQR